MATERGVVEPRRARSASRGKKLCTKPDNVNPSTRGHHVIQTMAALSRNPVPIQCSTGAIALSTNYRVVGNPRSIWDSDGCGHRVVMTLARV